MAAIIETPCIQVCEIDGATQLCIGCRRSLAEIARWSAMSSLERRRIIALLVERRAADNAKVTTQ